MVAAKKKAVKKRPGKKRASKQIAVKKPIDSSKSPKRRNAFSGGKLTARQQSFVNEFLIDLNATQAAIRAGYSERSARMTGSDNLSKPAIHSAIFNAMTEREKKVETSAKWVLDRLHTQAIADVGDLFFKEGSLKPIHDWPLVWRQGLVTEVETKQEYAFVEGERIPDGVVTKVKISERIKRDELIGKHHAMFTDNVNLGGDMVLRSKSDTELDDEVARLKKELGSK